MRRKCEGSRSPGSLLEGCTSAGYCGSYLVDHGPFTHRQLNHIQENVMAEASNRPENEDIEGLGSAEELGWGDYPIDTVLIRPENRTVHEILRRMNKGMFVMDPEFQRDFIWDVPKQSKLIESVIMRIPLPVFYLAEDDIGRLVVVDGLQRLSTFKRFADNELRLRLPERLELHGKRFEDLSPKLQNRVEDCNLALYVIDSKVPDRARLDIFDRVNGGVPLSRQQMRNSLYTGPASRFLKQEAASPLFRGATGGSLQTGNMRDREFVNRFCAFQLNALDQYKGEMDDFLALALKKMNKASNEDLEELSQQFRLGLKNNYTVFGKHAFRKHRSLSEGRSVLNASLWDVMSTGLSLLPNDQILHHKEALSVGFYSLMANTEFIDSITYSPNTTRKVRHRFETARKMIERAISANPD
jgi:Protein of unknown function DUF262